MKKIAAYLIVTVLLSPALYAFQQQDSTTPGFTISDPLIRELLPQENAAPAAAQQPFVYKKRTFNKGFKEEYKKSDFDYTEKKAADNALTRFLARVRAFVKKLLNGSQGASANTPVLQVILKTLVIAILLSLVIFIIISFVRGNTSWILFRKSTTVYRNSEDTEALMETDFRTLIQETETANDHRLAIRYYYLWLLQQLASRGFIKWNNDKTNTDYYYEIYDNRIRSEFKYLSYVYDYIWYGEFELDQDSYQKAKNAFRNTINIL